jgi:parvulin-like peptidyl-prolyl isomerase
MAAKRAGSGTGWWLVLWGLLGIALQPAAHAVAQPAELKPGGEIFARVDKHEITFAEYQAALAAGIRKKYYHSRPPVAELSRFQREVADQLIDRRLLLDETRRRGIEPDRARIDAAVAGYDKRYGASEQWRAGRDRLLPPLVAQLESQSVLERLEAAVREVPPPDAATAKAYYDTHLEQFTEPEQVRLSLILLKVEPSAPRAAWDQAAEEGRRLHQKLRKGADFAELARLHSADPSAARGGDLGYLHRGMLPELIEKQVIDSLQPGAYSEPVTLLEGVAIVRMEERKPARQRSFEASAKRAGELWQREQGEKAWQRLIARLRAAAVVQVDESRFLPAAAN